MSAAPGNVILVGFMGAGKSTVGRLLARRLGRCFVETDAMITAREGRSIPEIFAELGEPYFRQLEAEALEALADKHGHVVATGGGFSCVPGAMDRLLELGTVVFHAINALRAPGCERTLLMYGESSNVSSALELTTVP